MGIFVFGYIKCEPAESFTTIGQPVLLTSEERKNHERKAATVFFFSVLSLMVISILKY